MNSLLTAHSSEIVPTAPVAIQADRSLKTALMELTKARLTVMVLLTTVAGYLLTAANHHVAISGWRLFHTLLGTALVAVCSSILNQALECHTDARMLRTALRPFVTGRLPLGETIAVGMILGVLGTAELVWLVHPLTAVLAVLTLATYVVAYTPLKRVTSLNTLVGAIPGALPPLLGASAVQGHLSGEGWALFGLMLAWQLPHFYAIAWMYRDDYQQAGLKMISAQDPSGVRTGWHALISTLILMPASYLPNFIGQAGIFYAIIATVLNLGFIWPAWHFFEQPDRPRARCLFFVSITYLPLILIALALDVPIRFWL